jgi:exopolysaccharide production protein ExoQ
VPEAVKGVALAFSRAAAYRPPTADTTTPVAGDATPPLAVHSRHTEGLPAAAMIWVLLLLMIVPDGFDYSQLSSTDAPLSGGLLTRLLWSGLLLGGTALLLWRIRLTRSLLLMLNPWLLGFALLAGVSVLWSIEPAVTARRMIRIATILVLAVAFAVVAWHPRRFQSVLRPFFTLVLLGSIAFGLGWPESAIHQDGDEILIGAWRGLANHKNGMGSIACIAAILWFHAWLSREARLAPALLGGLLALTCLLLSRSSTALMATLFSMLFLILLLRCPPGLRRHQPALVLMLIATLLLYSLVLLQVLPGLSVLQAPIGAITGKDMTLTGRSEIWTVIKDHIRLHPWLGTGYGAYWTGAYEGAASYDFMLLLNFYPGSAHNGYLEVLNDLGALGLLLLFGYLIVFVRQCLRLLPVDRTQAALYLCLLMQQAIGNLAESRWFSVLSVDFVVMTLATAALARALLDQHARNGRQNSSMTAAPGRAQVIR